ncbi:MAG TPA: DedA family protein/thiosulfate sulfurtransferase GlpE [Nitrospiraceae bacterium]|nr:DedA family protein/thiosulfate sulfurtransferase GlpE [Nitrospiraceae bacterium]
MDEVSAFLIQYGWIVLFSVVFAEQIGLPLPAIPVLLAAGALAGAGKMNLAFAVLLSVVACLSGDVVWYELGRHRGRQALNLLCRIALEPDSCVRRTENFFTRHGTRALILAKFIPGLSTLAPALAGLFGIGHKRFLLYNGLGAALWTLAFILPGYVFSSQLEAIASHEARVGTFLLVALGIGLLAYIVYKFVHRQRVLRELRIARITADELKDLMDNRQEVFVVDLRGELDREADPYTIPGALRMTAEELEQRYHEIPRHRDVILFCACPNEATAAKMALMLRRKGITNVRPLAGGIDAWREREFPLEATARQAEPERVRAL